MKQRWMPLALSLVLVLTAGACRGKASPTPEAVEDPEVETLVSAPMVMVDAPVVEYRERELAEGRTLEEGDNFEVIPGANLITREGGRATVTWEGFLSQALLPGTDTLLSLSQPEMRYAILDQATGTARYNLLGAKEAASVTIKAASWAEVEISEGEADVIVSIVPGTEPASWVAVMYGRAEVRRGEDSLLLERGQVAAFTQDGEMPTVMDADRELLGDWYDDVESGAEGVGNIVSIAQRCTVTAEEAELLADAAADAESAGDPLPEGMVVAAIQRDEPGTFIRVTDEGFFEAMKDAESGLPEGLLDGWVAAADLDCNGPISGISMDAPEALSTEATATPIPLPTRGPVLLPPTVAYPTAGSATATRTATPGGEVVISFGVDDDTIARGECTYLRWRFKNIDSWYLDGGGGVGDTGEKKVCPTKTTTYNLRVVLRDGSERKESAKVTVTEPSASATPRASVTPRPPAATATDIVPPTSVPPTNTNPPPAPTDTDVPPAPTDTPAPPAPSDTPDPGPTAP